MNGQASPQNVWQFLLICFKWIGTKLTRGLGVAQGTIAIIAAQDGLLTQKQVAALVGLTALLTYWRGQVVSNTVDAAQTIVASTKVNEVPLSQTLKEIPK